VVTLGSTNCGFSSLAAERRGATAIFFAVIASGQLGVGGLAMEEGLTETP